MNEETTRPNEQEKPHELPTSSSKHDGVSQKVTDKDTTADEIAVDQLLSFDCHISNEGKGHKQVFDMSVENPLACNQQLFNSIGETGVTKDVDAVVSNATYASTQIVAELKEQEDNNQISPSQTGLKTDRSLQYKQVFNMSVENPFACNQQLFNSIRETGVTKGVDAVVSNANYASTQIVAELKEQEDNNQISPSQTGLKTDRSLQYKQVFNMSVENPFACNQQLFNSIRETGVTKGVDAVVSNAKYASTQIVAELKEQEDNNQISPSQTGLKTDRSLITDAPNVFTSSNPQGHMDEIDLNDDSVSTESEKISSEPAEPQQLHIDLHKYTEFIGQSKAAVVLLKRSLVKGVIARGTKMKDAVNEKISIASKVLETSTQNKCVVDADNPPPYLTTPNTINTATPGTPQSGATPCFFTHESSNTYGQISQHNLVPGVGNITNVGTFTSGPGFSDRSIQQLIPSAPMINPQPNNLNAPFRSRPENALSFRRLRITQPAGPLRGYNAYYPAPHGFHMRAPMPMRPPVSAMEYFENRYCSSSHPTPTCVPDVANPPPTIDRAHFSKMEEQRSPITRQPNYASSFFRLKSDRIKDNLQKLSASLSQTSRADPKADVFMEEGHIQRASMDSESDRFRRHGFCVMTPDDLLMGALCCCCWPVGLAARLVTLTMPNNDGPVDSIIKAMSHQMTSIALVLGIASYFVFFLLWLSFFVVAVK